VKGDVAHMDARPAWDRPSAVDVVPLRLSRPVHLALMGEQGRPEHDHGTTASLATPSRARLATAEENLK